MTFAPGRRECQECSNAWIFAHCSFMIVTLLLILYTLERTAWHIIYETCSVDFPLLRAMLHHIHLLACISEAGMIDRLPIASLFMIPFDIFWRPLEMVFSDCINEEFFSSSPHFLYYFMLAGLVVVLVRGLLEYFGWIVIHNAQRAWIGLRHSVLKIALGIVSGYTDKREAKHRKKKAGGSADDVDTDTAGVREEPRRLVMLPELMTDPRHMTSFLQKNLDMHKAMLDRIEHDGRTHANDEELKEHLDIKIMLFARLQEARTRLEKNAMRTVRRTLIWLLLSYGVCTRAFLQNYRCLGVAGVERFRLNLDVECSTHRIDSYLWIVMGWTTTVMIPLVFLVLAVRVRKRIYHPMARASLGVLFVGYKPEFAWWETVCLLRIYIFIEVSLMSDRTLRMEIILVLTMLSVVVHRLALPSDDTGRHMLHNYVMASHCGILLFVFCGMSFFEGEGPDTRNGSSTPFVAEVRVIIAIFANFLIMLAGFVAVAFTDFMVTVKSILESASYVSKSVLGIYEIIRKVRPVNPVFYFYNDRTGKNLLDVSQLDKPEREFMVFCMASLAATCMDDPGGFDTETFDKAMREVFVRAMNGRRAMLRYLCERYGTAAFPLLVSNPVIDACISFNGQLRSPHQLSLVDSHIEGGKSKFDRSLGGQCNNCGVTVDEIYAALEGVNRDLMEHNPCMFSAEECDGAAEPSDAPNVGQDIAGTPKSSQRFRNRGYSAEWTDEPQGRPSNGPSIFFIGSEDAGIGSEGEGSRGDEVEIETDGCDNPGVNSVLKLIELEEGDASADADEFYEELEEALRELHAQIKDNEASIALYTSQMQAPTQDAADHSEGSEAPTQVVVEEAPTTADLEAMLGLRPGSFAEPPPQASPEPHPPSQPASPRVGQADARPLGSPRDFFVV